MTLFYDNVNKAILRQSYDITCDNLKLDSHWHVSVWIKITSHSL